LDHLISPALVFTSLAIGGVGIALALPRKGVSPQVLGALLALVGVVILFGGLGLGASLDSLPNFNFYIFAFIALASALRVITHPQPVYAALFFILTILSSAALYLVIHAEFMAFALIMIYAGAILITYLFVIMLATQAPTEDRLEVLTEYDATAREPLIGAGAGVTIMVLVALLFARGVGDLTPNALAQTPADQLANLPRKVVRELSARGVFDAFERPAVTDLTGASGLLDATDRTIRLTLEDPERFREQLDQPLYAELFAGETSGAEAESVVAAIGRNATAGQRLVLRLPDSLEVTNVEGVGWALVAEHPMALELAGVVLTMALVGAVVLARKQIELSEDEKARHAHTLGETIEDLATLRREGA
jgi:NADH-quinone oxidoreductase subunit J